MNPSGKINSRRFEVKKKAFLVSVLSFLSLALLVKSSLCQEKEVLSLSLEDCILKALKENLKVAVETRNPELADAYLSRAKEFFLPSLEISYGNESTKMPSSWWLQQANVLTNKYTNYSASIVQQIPTGGNFSLSLGGYRSETNQGFQTINPLYSNTLRLDFTQPLLRNFGFKVSRKEILVARNNLDMSINQLQSVLIDTIYLVQGAYWNLVFSIEDYKVKTQSLQLAQGLLAKSRKEVELGSLAPIEILNAEATVASREADILQAEAQIKRSEDLVRNLINLNEEESQKRIVPLDKPEFVQKEVSMEEALKLAKERRPDLKMKRKDIETKELNLSVARNQLLPGLNLQFSYWSPGISGDRILYGADPFLGPIGVEKGSPGNALRDSLKLLYDNWNVGLTLSIPLSNFLSKADYVSAKIETEKSQLELKDSEKQIFLDIKNAVRDIETDAKRVQAYRVARELAEKRLEAEEKKLSVGLTTDYFVLQYQEELANAKSMELKSLVDYNLAWAALDRATGTSLEKHNIKTY
jgi:outer membrane protein TolC